MKTLKNRICLIYCIRNSFNYKVYIGQTWQSLKQRLYSHKSSKTSINLINAFNKYGYVNFNVEILSSTSDQLTADFLEKMWIKIYDSVNNGYNINEGGSGARQTDESRRKISIAKKGKIAEESNSAKLTYYLADKIREDYKVIKSSRKIATKYGIHRDTVMDVVNNIRWIRK